MATEEINIEIFDVVIYINESNLPPASAIPIEVDPTVPQIVKDIVQDDIDNWNKTWKRIPFTGAVDGTNNIFTITTLPTGDIDVKAEGVSIIENNPFGYTKLGAVLTLVNAPTTLEIWANA